MTLDKGARLAVAASFALLTCVALWAADPGASDENGSVLSAAEGCTFRANPSQFLEAEWRARKALMTHVREFGAAPGAASDHAAAAASSATARKNFIDDDIFSKLEAASVPAARLTTDVEFIRRVTLDLTGRLPSPDAIRSFVDSTSGQKREDLVNQLLQSPEFTDKWTTWLADLIQARESLSTSARAPQIEGRNSLDTYLRDAIGNQKPVRQIVSELVTGSGNNYFTENGRANYAVLMSTAMGPAQDTYDTFTARTASQFLGIAHYDCLLCHNGRGHLTGISAWGEQQVRIDAEKMAAHFARLRLNNGAPAGAKQYMDPLYNSTDVQDAATGTYDLNTTSGNRPNRVPVGTLKSLTPEYRDGSTPPSGMTWRQAYAQKLTHDPMFSRNFANRLWKAFFNLGLVDPVDTLDPDRLDPKNPPSATWTLQASHPELLEKLAQIFSDSDGDLRGFIRLIVQSNAYQLSSDYPYDWQYDYLSLYPRHYPRRLDAEEVHDVIAIATGVPASYTWPLVNGQTIAQGTPASQIPQSKPVDSAYKLPDTNEPRNNGAVVNFLNSFNRGNRDTAPRNQAGSILQRLTLMNDNFVLSRIKSTGSTASPVLAAIAKYQDNMSVIDDVFLRFLGRLPSDTERSKSLSYIQKATSRNTAVEDLAWACLNKLDFLFSY